MNSTLRAPSVELHLGFIQDLGNERAAVLQARFGVYKLGQALSEFGRDTTLDFPPCAKQAELMHVHYLTPERIKELKTKHKNTQFSRTSDIWLVYVQHMFDRGRYLLIAYVKEPAHKTCSSNRLLVPQYADIAENFHNS
ncbi:MAG: type II toxin-antitoxin system YafO family toxin [Oceanisphaera sp.]|uniref:type II toxin-antitoxin system YafO family toxin n=1 Tax=Oceanisphaera sp. TaxID=1929979 RepID=UPI003C73222F